MLHRANSITVLRNKGNVLETIIYANQALRLSSQLSSSNHMSHPGSVCHVLDQFSNYFFSLLLTDIALIFH